jgi:AcrR family transcriptional regulator
MPRLASAAGQTGEASAGPASTKDRILDTALDLFVEQGFDGTSVRQIAEQVGITKAALYYYFTSKDEILMALHMRLHDFGRDALGTMNDDPVTPQAWGTLLNQLMGEITEHRKIMLLHQRNQAAFEKLHRQNDHDEAHEDLLSRFQAILADPRVPLRDRVRMAGAVGVAFGAMTFSGAAFASATDEELRDAIAGAIPDVLTGPS